MHLVMLLMLLVRQGWKVLFSVWWKVLHCVLGVLHCVWWKVLHCVLGVLHCVWWKMLHCVLGVLNCVWWKVLHCVWGKVLPVCGCMVSGCLCAQ